LITSTHNPRIQWVRKLQAQSRLRTEEGVFVVEGVRLVEEALQLGWQPQLVLFTEDLSPRGKEILQHCLQNTLEQVSAAVMKASSDTLSPQGILAVFPLRSLPQPANLDFVLILDALRDPGNLGTILRTAAAAGVQAVWLAPNSADPFAPKVIRSAMGAHFRLPFASLDWSDIMLRLTSPDRRSALKLYLADSAEGVPYTRADFRIPLALVIGGEAEGAGLEARRLAGGRVYIPMKQGVESLNAAAAAAVLMFEVVRQRSL
jgi:RNA methyltransferase, TrmH family